VASAEETVGEEEDEGRDPESVEGEESGQEGAAMEEEIEGEGDQEELYYLPTSVEHEQDQKQVVAYCQ
jgi:hypothetical protein